MPLRALIPSYLKPLAKLACDDDQRPALWGVHVEIQADGGLRAEVTDGRQLVRLDCRPMPELLEEFLGFVATIPEGSVTKGTVPTEAWTQALGAAPKADSPGPPAQKAVLVAMDAESVTLLAQNGHQEFLTNTRLQIGVWPETGGLVPTKPPVARIGLDLRMLKRVVDVLVAVGDAPTTVVELRGPDDPIVFRQTSERQALTALVMPQRIS